MFENLKLDKAMYNVAGKSFAAVLQENDPDNAYSGTPYEGLDAFERQLKRFDIKVNGKNCDRVEKFFSTTESAVLFPEFIRRNIKKGLEESAFDDIAAAKTICEGSFYSGCNIQEDDYGTSVSQGAEMPASQIKEETSVTTLKKYGRVIKSSYEAVRLQKLDLFAVMLRSIGRKFSKALVKDMITALAKNASSINTSTTTLEYSDITRLCGTFTDFEMNGLIVSPAVAAQILAMQPMMNTVSETAGKIMLPFGALMIIDNAVGDTKLIGLDRRFALESISSGEIILETDKIIERQLDDVGISITAAFKKIFADAVKVLNITQS